MKSNSVLTLFRMIIIYTMHNNLEYKSKFDTILLANIIYRTFWGQHSLRCELLLHYFLLYYYNWWSCTVLWTGNYYLKFWLNNNFALTYSNVSYLSISNNNKPKVRYGTSFYQIVVDSVSHNWVSYRFCQSLCSLQLSKV